MINTGKCPNCDKTLTNVNIEDVTISVGFTPTSKGVSYVCPDCHSILSVQIDPVALKAEIIDAVIASLKRYPR